MTALGNEIINLVLDRSLRFNEAGVYSLWGNAKLLISMATSLLIKGVSGEISETYYRCF